MLDINSERIVSLSEAAALLPRRRQNRKPHVATLYRWSQRGCRGVVLETIQIGGTKCTSVEALQRFFDRLSGAPCARTPGDSARRQRVDRELRSEGLV